MRRRTLIAGLLLAVLTTACGSSSPPPIGPGPIVTPPGPDPAPTPLPPKLGVIRILAFGDSMTAGTTQPTFTGFTLTAGLSQSYPFKLQTLLAARYTTQAVDVFNVGVAGEKTAEGNARFAGRLSEAQPQLVLLMEGANDLNNPVLSLDVTSIVGRMEDMVRNATGRGIAVMLATLPPQRAGGRTAAAPGLLDKYNSGLRVMASKKGAILVDVNALFPLSLIGQDGLHPTEEGYQKMAEIFLDAIKSKFEAATAATATTARR